MIHLALCEADFTGIVEELDVVHLPRQAVELQVGEGVGKEMQIQSFTVDALREAAILGGLELGLGHGAAINGAAVVLHPPGVNLQGARLSRYPRAVGPTFMRRFPPRDTVSTSIRINISGDFQVISSR